ncbi:MAG TPA: methyltransferase domain-containing protein [Vicinamibacterales bacterium]|nr:methyltransferase domain-containing protein [Vicinamibacterales bacterium]
MSLVLGCAAILIAWSPPPVSAQSHTTQAAGSTAEQQVYDHYRDWTSGVPVDQRGAGLLTLYRQHLEKQGVPGAEIERQLAIIEREGRRLEADRWNAFFTAERPRFNVMPNAFLTQIAERRTPGTALDVGMGQGRNAIWLARQGWDVTGFDPAAQALAIAQRTAQSLGLSLKTVEARDDTFEWGENRWDLILLSYAGCSSENVSRIERALRPGGILIVEAFHTDAARQFKIGGSLCAQGQLPQMFQNLRTVHYEEPIALPDFGSVRMRIVRFAAEKPQQ